MPNLPVVFLACKVFKGIFNDVQNVEIIYLDYGLHSVPKQLKQKLQDRIDAIAMPSLVVLGYGLCGNGLNDIEAGKHTLIIPKADDCVAIFMGSRQRYLDQFNKNPGTYYLTKGWFEVGSDPLSEYKKLVEKYGADMADYLMKIQFQHYKHLVFVAHSQDDFDVYRPQALEIANYCRQFEMEYAEYLGSEDFIHQIAHVLENQQKISDQFIVVPPGETLRQDLFR